jgi:hypothetical protein
MIKSGSELRVLDCQATSGSVVIKPAYFACLFLFITATDFGQSNPLPDGCITQIQSVLQSVETSPYAYLQGFGRSLAVIEVVEWIE